MTVGVLVPQANRKPRRGAELVGVAKRPASAIGGHHDHRAENYPCQGWTAGACQAARQCQPSLQDDGLQPRQLLPLCCAGIYVAPRGAGPGWRSFPWLARHITSDGRPKVLSGRPSMREAGHLAAPGKVSRRVRADEPRQRMDHGKSLVARDATAAAVALQVIKELTNNGWRQILDCYPIDGASGAGAGEREQQGQRVTIAGLCIA